MLEVTLQLVCTRKPGTLSRVIREISVVGLHYQQHRINDGGDHIRLTIHASGEPNCGLASIKELFANFPEVIDVVQLEATRDGKPVTEIRTRVSEAQISTSDAVTPAVLLAAEKRLSDILGPIASVIVEAVAGDCHDAGELYTRLAAELNDDDERRRFLSVIEK